MKINFLKIMSLKLLKIKLIFLSLLFLFSCTNTTKKVNDEKSDTIQDRRTTYLHKKDWISPEDMEIILKGFTSIKQRGLWDENKRKQMFVEKLQELNIPDSTITRLALSAEKVIGARTGQWNYEYIEARFEVYKSEMKKDEAWKKLEEEYLQSLEGNSKPENN
jgi:hypothetical protein